MRGRRRLVAHRGADGGDGRVEMGVGGELVEGMGVVDRGRAVEIAGMEGGCGGEGEGVLVVVVVMMARLVVGCGGGDVEDVVR